MLVALVLLLTACAPDPAEQDFLDGYEELVRDQPDYPDEGSALDAGRTGCHAMAREDDAQDAVARATQSVADQLGTDEFVSTLVVALAAATLCPDDAPAGLLD